MKFNYIALTLITLCAPLMANWCGERAEIIDRHGAVLLSVEKRIYSLPIQAVYQELRKESFGIDVARGGLPCPYPKELNSGIKDFARGYTYNGIPLYYNGEGRFNYVYIYLPQVDRLSASPSCPIITANQLLNGNAMNHVIVGTNTNLDIDRLSSPDCIDDYFNAGKDLIKKNQQPEDIYREISYLDGKPTVTHQNGNSYKHSLWYWAKNNRFLATIASLGIISTSCFTLNYLLK